MNTPSEFPRQQPLLDSLLAETAPPEFRAAVLKQTLACARRRQTRRRAGTLALASALVLLVAAPALRHARPTPPRLAASSQPAPRVVPGTQIRILSDAELLDFFPDRPVALIGAGPTRRLVFLDDPGRQF